MESTLDFESPSPFEPGQVYNRREDLHGHYGGQHQGGISTPAEYPIIFLISTETGSRYGYKDEFRPDGTYWFTGEGQAGDMEMKRGNRAVRDHIGDNKEMHLFEGDGEGQVWYVGQARYLDHHWEERRDENEEMRDAIIFELAVDPTSDLDQDGVEEPTEDYDESSQRWWTRDEDKLREIALRKSRSSTSERDTRQRVYRRARAVQVYVRRRAEGVCEGCGREAPFETPQGRPYLEAHHVRRVSDGGPDHPRWVIALCPNCHRRVHHGQDGDEYNETLIQRLDKIECS